MSTESKVKPLSKKAINSIVSTGYLNVWEGAVRSSKTVVSCLAWVNYITRSKERFFVMTGKTIATLYRNVLGGEYGLLNILGSAGNYRVDRDGNRILTIRTEYSDKMCYCMGANDEGSYSKLRGLTVGGWYADEVSLHPKSFIEEAFRRTIVSSDRKHFWTLNPENPNHYIYTEYLDKYLNEELPGFYLWHFTLEDNNALPPERKEELKRQYSGLFYRRYILGERCMAEGVVYDMLGAANLYNDNERPENLEHTAQRTISVDYGTVNPCVFLDIYDDGVTLWVDNEYRWDSKSETAMRAPRAQKTDTEYADDMEAFMGTEYPCEIVCDPSAASFIRELKNRLLFASATDEDVVKADNAVINGIRAVSSLMKQGQIKIHERRCKGLLDELRSYAWDEKASARGKEKPVKKADHGCVAGDTLVCTEDGQVPIMGLVGMSGKLWCYDEKTKRMVLSPFSSVSLTQRQAEVYEVELDNGAVIAATADHPFLTERGWIRLDELTEHDRVLCAAALAPVRVKAVRPAGRADVFNLYVDEHHNFSANGIILHNCDALRYFVYTKIPDWRTGVEKDKEVT
jgi:PBSX family phage terminase large subunit